ncbi:MULTISPECIES: hypothetical protein [unclassified Pseudofrankia]|uniref:hypothetical protein n=1 Tax=unclassified Pseudofrankia TaxID=2994372 RepID=UPI001041E263|nr:MULTISPECIES: hypothetical protein [unclassified Pseudofrankia]MDT3443713.1 hypothetical protein [Pseudofrankia sp. BMG5.37]
MTSESRPKDGRTEDRIPADARDAPAPRVPRRHLDLDWEREPAQDVDPEDSLRGGNGGGDDLARLLADVPPHHVDRASAVGWPDED